MKWGESHMEVRNSSDVRYLDLNWVSVEKSNLVREWLVPSEVGRSQASGEVGCDVEHYLTWQGE
jgi:hypothetical protein